MENIIGENEPVELTLVATVAGLLGTGLMVEPRSVQAIILIVQNPG